MEPVLTEEVAQRYARFAAHEATPSPVFRAWASGVAADPRVSDLIASLPARERQPNLVFAAARLVDPALVDADQHDARPDEYERLARVLLQRWDEVAAVTASHATQTNEAGRIGVLLPALSTVHRACGKPLALIEFGASAGLVLHPDAWHYRYPVPGGSEREFCGSSQVLGELIVRVTGGVELPQSCPQVGWKLGIDLHPLDLRKPDTRDWLRLLIWPGETTRRERVEVAIAAADRDPVLVIPRDLTQPGTLDEVLALVPPDVHPVIMHSAVLAYVDDENRRVFGDRLLEAVAAGRCSWVSNEGAGVVPQVAERLATDPRFADRETRGAFVVAVDGVPQYLADGHATWIG